MNHQLHDLMHRDVRELNPDLTALTIAARRQGLSIRRRRQALSTVGAAGIVAVIAVAATQLPWATGDTRTPAATAPASVQPSPTPPLEVPGTAVLTGEGTAAGLRYALESMAEGRSTDFAGQPSDVNVSGDSFGELRWHPADGSGFSDVGLNVQPGFDEDIYRCEDWQRACTLTRSGGATLMTYEEVTGTAGGNGIRVVSDLLRVDGVRVVASATNGEDLPSNKWRITRPRPAFTAEELTRVVSQPWWGPRLPAGLQQAGKALPGYTDLDADRGDWIDGQPSAEATPTPTR
jgi:hypothetical protein